MKKHVSGAGAVHEHSTWDACDEIVGVRGRGQSVGSPTDNRRRRANGTKGVIVIEIAQSGQEANLGRQWGRVDGARGHSGEGLALRPVSPVSG